MNAPAHPPSNTVGSPAVIECHDPATRELLGVVDVASPSLVREAVARARAAQIGWADTSFAQRRAVLRRMLEHILAHTDELCDAIVRDSGKTRENALMGEIWPVCEKLRWTIAKGERFLRPEPVSAGLLLHKRARLEFHPLGVIGAIVPWNYPFQNILNPVIPALMAGNACIVKPSEWVAWSSPRVVDVAREALRLEGHDPELVQLVNGYGETGKALIEARVDGLVFIGSGRNGRRVLEAAAQTVTPVVLELGGKDPFIVCDDADLEQAAHAAMAGCFISAGQNCVASERLLVFDAVYARFEARMRELVGAMRQGAPRGDQRVDMGAMVTPLQLEVVERLVARAIEQGARVVVGGKRVLAEQGDFFAPTVLADVTPDMDIMREETFGPVMLLCRVNDEHEAIAIANGIEFGLSSSVFSRDLSRARRIASRLHAGMTAINEFGGMSYMAQDLTFGGVKDSGFGRMNGRDGLRSFCNVKAVLDDRFPLHFPSKLFPVQENDFGRIQAAVEMVYSPQWGGKMRGLAKLVRRLRGRT